MTKFCKSCGSTDLQEKTQIFKDNSEHTRLDCTSCGAFNGYVKQNNGFDCLLAKSDCIDDINQFNALIDSMLNKVHNLYPSIVGKSASIVIKVR